MMMQCSWIWLDESDGGLVDRQATAFSLPTGARIEDALQTLGYSQAQTNLLLSQRAVSVFGLYARPQTTLHPGDRIEILDALRFDPMESRRRRAEHKAKNNAGVNQQTVAKPRRSKKQA